MIAAKEKEIIIPSTFNLFLGPMFSGKTTHILELVRFYENHSKVICFKPQIDSRYAKHEIVSHDGLKHIAHNLSNVEDMIMLSERYEVVVIDEIQFFEPRILEVISILMDREKMVFAAGLDTDFLGNPFGCIDDLKKMATKVEFVQGDCAKCNNPSTNTYRHSKDKNQIVLGSDDIYESRCADCFKKGANL